MNTEKTCDVCRELVDEDELKLYIPDDSMKEIWLCKRCDSWIGEMVTE
jgi:hypothetical protein